jgi:hypothetical protein
MSAHEITLIPDPQVQRELNVSRMTLWRWDAHPQMAPPGWPPVVYLGRYKHRSASEYQNFKSNLLKRAIERRSNLFKQ